MREIMRTSLCWIEYASKIDQTLLGTLHWRLGRESDADIVRFADIPEQRAGAIMALRDSLRKWF